MARLGRIQNYHFHFNADADTFRLARALRKDMTKAEAALWHEIRNRRLMGLKFRRQHPVGWFIVDFYCPSIGLVIEVDGGIHCREAKRQKDLNRTAELERLGLKVIRFTNDEILTDMKSVMAKISATISPPLQNGEGAGG